MNTSAGNLHDASYESWLQRMTIRSFGETKGGDDPLFVADVPDLWDRYLRTFSPETRQYHTCKCCQRFVENYGALVTIDQHGRTKSALWDAGDLQPDQSRSAVVELIASIEIAPIKSVFYTDQSTLGNPVTGKWRHMALTVPKRNKSLIKNAHQVACAKREDRNTVARALDEFKQEHLDQAVTLLKNDALYRSEKVLGAAEWLCALQRTTRLMSMRREELLWRAVAMAPEGFCHPRSGMIGTLLEDLAAEMPLSRVAERFKAKMNPLQYMRPQAAPSAGAIAEAEKIVAKLASAGAFRRRVARPDEIQTFWKAPETPTQPEKPGVFSALLPKQPEPKRLALPLSKITMRKFREEVLPNAQSIEYLVPSRCSFAVLMTCDDPNAPPVLQWDSEEKRNPVSWYYYTGGQSASHWSLRADTWVRVLGLCEGPPQWSGPFPHQGEKVIFLLEGARESNDTSIALFPECLRSEYHSIRSVIEAHSNRSRKCPNNGAHALGPSVQKGKHNEDAMRVRVKTHDALAEYLIDRWD